MLKIRVRVNLQVLPENGVGRVKPQLPLRLLLKRTETSLRMRTVFQSGGVGRAPKHGGHGSSPSNNVRVGVRFGATVTACLRLYLGQRRQSRFAESTFSVHMEASPPSSLPEYRRGHVPDEILRSPGKALEEEGEIGGLLKAAEVASTFFSVSEEKYRSRSLIANRHDTCQNTWNEAQPGKSKSYQSKSRYQQADCTTGCDAFEPTASQKRVDTHTINES